MTTGALADMWLANLPSYHSWAPFSTDSNSQVIEFPKLKRLWAIYFTVNRDGGFAGRHRDGHPWRLHFPSLKTLNVECTQNTCPLLEYAVLPPHMESIHIQLHVATYLSIANRVLPTAKRITIRTTSGASGDASGLPAINRILESACASESLGLEINDRLLPVVPESITCTTLTQLLIAARTSLDTMLAFIERLPRLVSLTLYDLGVNAIQTDISVPDADEETVVEPLRTSLESLTIKYDIWTHSPDRAVAVAKFVLLKIPTLTKLLAVQTPESPVISFAEEYTPRYPHLSDVELELYRR
ncbi:hypothetical protein H4R21_003983 [Coemansia helicoidea]|uniref:Uncharacterized protein n=1 Tax=Coemansia helicoidea TaxID=1286919 RepID=A0ACC1L0P7_9FUNG|nr:hypothetical protein H4R21_003983 [Coemansia helicoidea]